MTDLTAVAVVALYAGLNGLILLWLGAGVAQQRSRLGVFVGDGGQPRLIRAMRGQANFVEFVPMSLILMFAMAFLGAPHWVLHLFGVTLTAGRILHGIHFMRADAPGWLRSVGAMMSVAVLGFGALGLIAHAAAAL